MFYRLTGLGLTFVLFTLLACASRTTPLAPGEEKAPVALISLTTKETWEMQWQRVKEEARKEGKVVLYTTAAPELRTAVMKAIKEYGIALETVSGRTTELAERLFRERKAGIYNADLWISGPVFIVEMKREGMLSSVEPLLILPEVKDLKMWHKGELNFFDKEKIILSFGAYLDPGIHINTDIMKTGDINSMQDLLSPRWKNKIIMDDPTVSGRGNKWMTIAALRLGEDYIHQLTKLEPLITRDRKLLMDWIAKGRYPIGLGGYPDIYIEYKRAGAPVNNLFLKEMSYIETGVNLLIFIGRAPHPYASRVFVNWLLSKEGQTLWHRTRNTQSARLDVPVDHLIQTGMPVRQPGVEYYDTRSETWELEIKPGGEKIIQEIFRPLVR